MQFLGNYFPRKNESGSGPFILFLSQGLFLISELLPLELWECPQSTESITAGVCLGRPDSNTDWRTETSVSIETQAVTFIEQLLCAQRAADNSHPRPSY